MGGQVMSAACALALGQRPCQSPPSASPLPGNTDGAGRNLGRLLKPLVPSRGLQTTWTARDLEQRQTVRNPERGQAHCSPGAQGQGADLDTTCILGESGDWPQLQKLDLWSQGGLLGRGAQRGEPHRELSAARSAGPMSHLTLFPWQLQSSLRTFSYCGQHRLRLCGVGVAGVL